MTVVVQTTGHDSKIEPMIWAASTHEQLEHRSLIVQGLWDACIGPADFAETSQESPNARSNFCLMPASALGLGCAAQQP